jgi:hypothetical protein
MDFAGKITKLLIAGSATAGALALFSATAMAGTADYPSTATFGIPNNTGQSGLPSQVFVPPGRTAVQSVQITKFGPSYGGGGGGDFQARLKSPSGTEINLISNACLTYPNTSAFTISDTATQAIDNNPAFCTALAGNPTGTAGRPTDPLSAFNGLPSAGAWTVTVVDQGANNIVNGSFNGWSLQITHAPPTVTGSAAPFKVKGRFALTATCDANCTVTTGGAAGKTTTQLAANSPGTIIAPATKKAKKKGKGVVTLTATDQTGGTTTASVNAKTIKAKPAK